MQVICAQAKNNGIVFYGKRFYVSMNEKKDGSTEYKIKKYKREVSKSNIYFLRGIIDFFTLKSFRALMVLWAICVLFTTVEEILLKYLTYISAYILNAVSYGAAVAVLIIVFVAFIPGKPGFSSVWLYHGAEHKIINALDNHEELSLANVRKQSRYCNYCGSILILFWIPVSSVFFVLAPESFLYIFPLIYSIALELFYIKDAENKPVIKYFYKLGRIIQNRFITKEPTDKMINDAITAVNKLTEAEEE